MNNQEINKLKIELLQFTGSEQFYKHPLFKKYVYTEGVRYLAKEAGAYWLLEYIFSNQYNSLAKQPFQIWKLKVSDDETAIITIEDGNENKVKSFNLEYTDFPLEEITLWFIDGTLLLPSEY